MGLCLVVVACVKATAITAYKQRRRFENEFYPCYYWLWVSTNKFPVAVCQVLASLLMQISIA